MSVACDGAFLRNLFVVLTEQWVGCVSTDSWNLVDKGSLRPADTGVGATR